MSGSNTPLKSPFTNMAGECLVFKTAQGLCLQIAYKNSSAFDGLYVRNYWSVLETWSSWRKLEGTVV